MKYFFDTEFHEYPKKRLFKKSINTIDFISIGIVAEDGREYYAISKDFDLKDAWNSWQPDSKVGSLYEDSFKEYWLRENVLKPIFDELLFKENDKRKRLPGIPLLSNKFTYKTMKYLVKVYGKSNKQVAEDIKEFTDHNKKRYSEYGEFTFSKPEFYAYYADYDWVVFCWLFGKMMSLPSGFPKYCKDLKQVMDETEDKMCANKGIPYVNLKAHVNYPKQTNEHNALADAKWNLELYKFLKTI